MIKSLLLNNVQSHKESKLEFDPGVNIIVGSSDSGKTAILRGLICAITNKPPGDGLRRFNSKETEIVLELDNATISRLKTNSRNEYQIDDGEPFKAFGQGVPDEITKVLNISPLNIQQQMDSPFLLDDSAGEVAKALNAAVNLDGIDTALFNINKKQKDTRDDIKAKKTSIDSLRMDLDEFDYLEQMESDISILVELERRLDKTNDRADSIDTILIQHKKITAEQAELSDFLQIEPDICLLQEKAQEQADTAEKAYDLKVLLLAIEQRGCEIAEFTIIAGAGDIVESLRGLDDANKYLIADIDKLSSLMRSITVTEQNIKTYTDDLKEYEDKFHDLMPDECPFGECVIKGGK